MFWKKLLIFPVFLGGQLISHNQRSRLGQPIFQNQDHVSTCSVASLSGATLYLKILIGTTNPEILYKLKDIYTPCECAAGMLLHINGKFTMGKLKSSLLYSCFVLNRPLLSIYMCRSRKFKWIDEINMVTKRGILYLINIIYKVIKSPNMKPASYEKNRQRKYEHSCIGMPTILKNASSKNRKYATN